VTEELAAKIGALPEEPGIYVFLGAARQPLYVGKARSLRRRVGSYLARDLEPRLERMLAEATDLDYLVTRDEVEALELENQWIKRHRPRFNVLLRDDKTYPYLKLTSEPWPRIAFTRRIRPDGADYFGPFLPGGLARRAIKLVQKLFGVRVCRIEIDGRLPRPCLYHDMRRCLAPCVEGLTTPAEYGAAAERARHFLAGRTERLLRELRRAMEEAAERLAFEEAARLRDVAAEVEALSGGNRLSTVTGDDVDVFGVHAHGNQAAFAVLVMRGGHVVDRHELFWEGQERAAPERLLAEVLPQYYARTTFLPGEIHLPLPLEEAEALADWLSQRRGRRVHMRWPARGPWASRLELARRNAGLAFRRRFRGAGTDPGAQALQEHLELPEPPRRVEGLDVSTFQGAQTFAALVVWQEGRLRKSAYRSFGIRGTARQDDFASLRQAIERHLGGEPATGQGEGPPDLLLVDGGRGQLNAALEALAALGLEEIPVVGLAKRAEEVFVPGRAEPLRLPASDPGLQLLQRLRDEAHRFALARHRRRRSREALASRLEEIPGIGPRRRQLLLRRHGSAAGVAAASEAELAATVGPVLAARLRSWFDRGGGREADCAAPTAAPGGSARIPRGTDRE